MARGRRIVVVSGTNGKTTTTAMLAASWRLHGPVCSNADGANLSTGVAAALLGSDAEHVVLEVDEVALPGVLERVSPEIVVLLNLSRDQMDRSGEVSGHVRRWAAALRTAPVSRIIANADDPLVVASCQQSRGCLTWVSAGLSWQRDAGLCRRCRGTVLFPAQGWLCDSCGWRRPPVSATVAGRTLLLQDQTAVDLKLAVPGQTNRANAAMALVTAQHLGVELAAAAQVIRQMAPVLGRYQRLRRSGQDIQLLLMKNPAGGQASLGHLKQTPGPVILAINARAADGRDTSWLWDVPFETLAGRQVVVTGERATDVAVRLAYAGIPCTVTPTVVAALAALPPGPCHVLANYTAFSVAHRALGLSV
jgi:UDP-N-acetylmuramyl tripeptide synthase